MYRALIKQAVDTITLTIDSSLLDEKLRVSYRRALIISGHFLTWDDDLILKKSFP